MGSTVAAVMLSGTKIITANVGDSPIYLIRNKTIEPIFVPHTYMAEHAAMASAGAKTKPLGEEYRHMITRAVGIKAEVQPDISEIQGLEGDILLLCSDGLSDLVNERELLAVVTKFPPKKAVKALVHLANKRGGDDNITIIILRLEKHPNRVQRKDTGPAQASTERLAAIHGIPVDIDTEEATLSAHIKRISPGGGYVETTDPFTVGEEITMTFADPSGQGYFTVDGRVSERDQKGIDIAFHPLREEQRSKLKRLIGQ
jgi:PilZ domain/Protein phosphatase 2C